MAKVTCALLFCILLLMMTHTAKAHEKLDRQCGWEDGGFITICAKMADKLHNYHRVPWGLYQSAGVMILKNASCVERGSIFRFHSAYYLGVHGPILAPVGNEIMIHYLDQWPRLVSYLHTIGAFTKIQFTDVFSNKLATLGIPTCK